MNEKLRGPLPFIKPKERKIVITDFEDEIGAGATINMPDVGSGVDKAKFKRKVRRFVDQHRDHIALIKVHRGQPLTAQDIAELQRMMIDEDVADTEAIAALDSEGGLGPSPKS